jgi:hypothetical protein
MIRNTLHARMLRSISRIWESTRRALTEPLCDPYRPEKHYMRGPGPKWRNNPRKNSVGRSSGH